MSKPICIYHSNCMDGFTAAWAISLGAVAYDFYPGVYQDPPPDVTGRDVLLVDFSYKRAVISEMRKTAKSITILDHHKTAIEDLSGLDLTDGAGLCPLVMVFDLERSGAGLAWDLVFPDEPRTGLIDYVEDRDLWRFKKPLSREVNAFIASYEFTFENWTYLAALLIDHMGVQTAAEQGGAILRKHDKDVAETVKACKRRMVIDGREVWGAGVPPFMTSDAGNLMAQGMPFAACYWDTIAFRTFSLRSTKGGLDVSEIAKRYGGGGHRNAAGFKVPFTRILEFEVYVQ